MGIITWGIGMTRIELDAHRCQIFLCKMSVEGALYCLIAKAVHFYKSNLCGQNLVKCGQNLVKCGQNFVKCGQNLVKCGQNKIISKIV